MGASAPVPLEKRVPVWIDLVPRLLAHLNIPHVALASHSAGMIYLLNVLFHCRELLHPERPYVAFLGNYLFFLALTKIIPNGSNILTPTIPNYI